MLKLLVVGAGGFVGAISRYLLSGLVHRLYNGSFPLGTLVVNVAGCFLIGALMGLVEDRQALSPNVRLFLMIGLIGSFTTFSTLCYETYELFRTSEMIAVMVNVFGSALLGLSAVLLGRAGIGLLMMLGGPR